MSRKSFLVGLIVGIASTLALTLFIPSLAVTKPAPIDNNPLVVLLGRTPKPSSFLDSLPTISPSPTPDPEPWPDDPEEAYYYGFDEGHLLGFESGYEEGYSEGWDTGWDDGYDSGYDSGYADGYYAAEYDMD